MQVWFVVALCAAGAIANVLMVGKQREPLGGGTVAITIILNAWEICLLFTLLRRIP